MQLEPIIFFDCLEIITYSQSLSETMGWMGGPQCVFVYWFCVNGEQEYFVEVCSV